MGLGILSLATRDSLMIHGDNIYDPGSLSLNHYVDPYLSGMPCARTIRCPSPLGTSGPRRILLISRLMPRARVVPFLPWKLHATPRLPPSFSTTRSPPLSSRIRVPWAR